MNKNLQAIIFDLDGVIVDSFELYYITNKKVAEKLSLPFTREDNEIFRGIGRSEIVKALIHRSGKSLTEKELKELADSKNKHYQQLIHSLDENAILPGMNELISTLVKNNIKLGLASSSTNSKTVLAKIGLLHYFDVIVDPSILLKGKPDPEIFIRAADGLGVPHKNCAAIEDGEAGLKAIKSTKMFSVGIGKAVEKERPDWHVMSTGEISYHELLKRFYG
jgi:beta-phosphoglucomutase